MGKHKFNLVGRYKGVHCTRQYFSECLKLLIIKF